LSFSPANVDCEVPDVINATNMAKGSQWNDFMGFSFILRSDIKTSLP